MDLKEIKSDTINRHPWELSRVKALRAILDSKNTSSSFSILDVGCGDGFTVGEIYKEFTTIQINAVDNNLSAAQIKKYSTQYKNIHFYNSFNSLTDRHYDLILLLDVIEHIEDATAFVSNIIERYATEKTKILITAPAFNSLFSSHDLFLKHYKRYNLKELLKLVEKAGLLCKFSGYLFFLLVFCRFISVYMESIRESRYIQNTRAGSWNGGYLFTKLLTLLLNFDNFISLFLNRFGIKIPGLTVWALCQKRQ